MQTHRIIVSEDQGARGERGWLDLGPAVRGCRGALRRSFNAMTAKSEAVKYMLAGVSSDLL
jgi:hypothetical protein